MLEMICQTSSRFTRFRRMWVNLSSSLAPLNGITLVVRDCLDLGAERRPYRWLVFFSFFKFRSKSDNRLRVQKHVHYVKLIFVTTYRLAPFEVRQLQQMANTWEA